MKARGERVATSKLTEQAVVEIRAMYGRSGLTQRDLGEVYGVNHTTIGSILRRETWRHVDDRAEAA